MATNEVIVFTYWQVAREIKRKPITREMTYCQCAGCKFARARRHEAEREQRKEMAT